MLDQMAIGRSIRLFLADGSPHGLVVAEIGNWSGKVLAVSRSRVPDLLRRPEAARTGVYVLLGADPDRPGGILAYVGEADDVAARLRHHLRSEAKDFFERLAVIVSSADTLTKGHVRYLESQLIRLVREAGTVALTNDTHPDFQRLPEADRADMDFFIAQVVTVLPLLGFDLFRRAAPAAADDGMDQADATFTFTTAGATARARETDDGFVVLAGSTARVAPSATFPAGYLALRDQLLAQGKLVADAAPDLYRFAEDIVFASPSAAASIVAARSASGPLEWKLATSGRTYRDWREAQLRDNDTNGPVEPALPV